ncbi:MAG TPA: hypothetical protein VF857_11505, partial [Spirochaetota bacterium]
EVVFELTNTEDTPRDLYIFVLASHEEQKWVYNSFRTKRSVPERVDVDLFVPVPSDRANFEYDINGAKLIKKYAKDYKLGVDPSTGKAYHLKDKVIVRTEHLSPYRKNYTYFNNATVLVYDDEGKLLFRQIYALNGFRTR